jgi:hypothetical protein
MPRSAGWIRRAELEPLGAEGGARLDSQRPLSRRINSRSISRPGCVACATVLAVARSVVVPSATSAPSATLVGWVTVEPSTRTLPMAVTMAPRLGALVSWMATVLPQGSIERLPNLSQPSQA